MHDVDELEADNKRERLLAPSSTPLPARLRRTLFWRTVPLLAVGYGFCFVDRSNLAFGELKMRSDPKLNLTTTDFALSAGIFFAGYATMQVPALHCIERIGARRVVSALLVIWGLLGSACGLIQNTTQLCALRFALGLAEAGYYPGVLYHFTTWLPDEMLGIASAAFTMTGAGVGIVVGNLSSGAILSAKALDGLLGLAAWRWLFLLQGFPAVLVGFAVYTLLSDSPRSATWLSDEQRAALLARLASSHDAVGATADDVAEPVREQPASAIAAINHHVATAMPAEGATSAAEPLPPPAAPPPLPLLIAVYRTLRRRVTYVMIGYYFGNASGAYVLIFFLPLLLSELLPSWTPFTISCLVAFPSLLGVVVAVSSAAWVDSAPSKHARLRRRLGMMVCGSAIHLTLGISAGLAMLRASSPALSSAGRKSCSVLSLVLLSLAVPVGSVGNGPFWATHHELQPNALKATSIAVINAMGNLGGFAGPFVLGALKTTLGPPCPPARVDGGHELSPHHHGCVSQWAWGMVLTFGATQALSLMTCALLIRISGAARRAPGAGSSGGDGAAGSS